MSKDTDNSDNPDLLNALESIKGLLEQSESKLSAARESLKKAKSPDISESIVRPAVSNEPVVPVLDDIVDSGESVIEPSEDENASLLEQVPELDEFLELEESAASDSPAELPVSGHTTDEILTYLSQLQLQLEQKINETLMQTVNDIEAELKKTLNDEFQKIITQLAESDD